MIIHPPTTTPRVCQKTHRMVITRSIYHGRGHIRRGKVSKRPISFPNAQYAEQWSQYVRTAQKMMPLMPLRDEDIVAFGLAHSNDKDASLYTDWLLAYSSIHDDVTALLVRMVSPRFMERKYRKGYLQIMRNMYTRTAVLYTHPGDNPTMGVYSDAGGHAYMATWAMYKIATALRALVLSVIDKKAVDKFTGNLRFVKSVNTQTQHAMKFFGPVIQWHTAKFKGKMSPPHE